MVKFFHDPSRSPLIKLNSSCSLKLVHKAGEITKISCFDEIVSEDGVFDCDGNADETLRCGSE